MRFRLARSLKNPTSIFLKPYKEGSRRMKIEICDIPAELKKNPDVIKSRTLGFGQLFTDRMFITKWNKEKGWHDAKIQAHQALTLDPAALVFHYGQEIFEGLKAYRQTDGGVSLFRPEMNCIRMNQSAKRLMMPTIPVELQLEAIKKLVSLLNDWVPSQDGYSLYLRPTMIGSNAELGIKPASEYLYFIICSPVSGYFADGFKTIKIVTSEKYARAAEGGTGAAKCGGNYAASLKALKEAKEAGYAQNVWLDGKEHRYIEEMGGMNIMFAYGNTIKTCPLTGTILPGVTRDSLMKLLPEFGCRYEETLLDVDQVCSDIDDGLITEIFACGTAAVVTPIHVFAHKGVEHFVGDGEPGEISTKLYEKLTGIQTGKVEDKYGWNVRVI